MNCRWRLAFLQYQIGDLCFIAFALLQRVQDQVISHGFLRFLAAFDLGRNPFFPDIANDVQSSLRQRKKHFVLEQQC